MSPVARTPEELEALLEDACIVGDADELVTLFEPGALLVTGHDAHEAYGSAEILDAARAMCRPDGTYVAAPQRVLQARDTALSLGNGINVLRRGGDGSWRYVIALMQDLDGPGSEKDDG